MEEYLNAFRQGHFMGGVSMALAYLTTMAATMGDFETASRVAEEGMTVRQTLHLSHFSGRKIDITYDVAYVDFLNGNLAEARLKMETGIKDARQNHDNHSLAVALLLLGRVACYDDKPEEGQAALEESWSLIDHPSQWPLGWLDAELLLSLGHAANLLGDYDRAAGLYKQFLELQREKMPSLPGGFEKFANLMLHIHEPARAAKLLGAAENLRRTMGAPIPPVEQAEYHESLGLLSSQLSNNEKEEAWNMGAAMALEEVIAFVLEDQD